MEKMVKSQKIIQNLYKTHYPEVYGVVDFKFFVKQVRIQNGRSNIATKIHKKF